MSDSDENEFFTEDIFEDLEDLEEDLVPETPEETQEPESPDDTDTIGPETSTITQTITQPAAAEQEDIDEAPVPPAENTGASLLSMSMAQKLLIGGLLLMLLASVTAFTYLYISINRLSTKFSQPAPVEAVEKTIPSDASGDVIPRYKISISPTTPKDAEVTDIKPAEAEPTEKELPPPEKAPSPFELLAQKMATGKEVEKPQIEKPDKTPESPPTFEPDEKSATEPPMVMENQPAAAAPTDQETELAPPEKKRKILSKPKPENLPPLPVATDVEISAAKESETTIPDLTNLLKDNAYLQAAYEFHRHLSPEGRRFTIRLEVDCEKESVQTAFQRGNYQRDLFILPIHIKERPCFVVLWGVFDTEKEAKDAISGLPPFFRSQSPKPAVVSLSQYL